MKNFTVKSKYLRSKNYLSISAFSFVTDGEHGSPNWDTSSNIKYITAEHIKPNYIDEKDFNTISIEQDKKNTRSRIRENDVLIYTVGAYAGFAAKAEKHLFPANIPRSVAIIRPDDKIKAEYLSLFLNSKYGVFQTLRFRAGNSQPMLALEKINQFEISILEFKTQEVLSNIYNKAYQCRLESKKLYKEAEQLLLQELGITKIIWHIKGLAINNKSFKESFADSGRLDAEYYQPKYDIIQNHLKQFEQIKLKDLVSTPITSGSTPKAGDSQYYTDASDGIPFIRAVDIGNNRVSLDDLNYIRRNVHEGVLKKTQLKQNDVLFSIAGTVGRCGIFDHDVKANINQACAILRFNEDLISRLYLILFFNSEVGQQINEKYARQGVQTNLNMDEIGNLQIPILAMPTQQQIASLIQQSFQLRKQSKHLLDIAKQAVEMAIETDETTAMAFIKAKAE